MKKLIVLFFALLLAQLSVAQNGGHATIDSVKVRYKGSTLDTSVIAVQAIPEVSVSLKTTTVTLSKIYLKIKNPVTNSVLYDVNYSLASAAITNNAGVILFQNDNGLIRLSGGTPLALRPYTFEIKTEDNLQNQSTVFTLIR